MLNFKDKNIFRFISILLLSLLMFYLMFAFFPKKVNIEEVKDKSLDLKYPNIIFGEENDGLKCGLVDIKNDNKSAHVSFLIRNFSAEQKKIILREALYTDKALQLKAHQIWFQYYNDNRWILSTGQRTFYLNMPNSIILSPGTSKIIKVLYKIDSREENFKKWRLVIFNPDSSTNEPFLISNEFEIKSNK